jgi:hypothetical protein
MLTRLAPLSENLSKRCSRADRSVVEEGSGSSIAPTKPVESLSQTRQERGGGRLIAEASLCCFSRSGVHRKDLALDGLARAIRVPFAITLVRFPLSLQSAQLAQIGAKDMTSSSEW